MADLDDLREGADFGLGINCENQSFHVKGAENLPWGMKDRLSRIFNPKTGKALCLLLTMVSSWGRLPVWSVST